MRVFHCTFDGEKHEVEAETHSKARYKLAKSANAAFGTPIRDLFKKISVKLAPAQKEPVNSKEAVANDRAQ